MHVCCFSFLQYKLKILSHRSRQASAISCFKAAGTQQEWSKTRKKYFDLKSELDKQVESHKLQMTQQAANDRLEADTFEQQLRMANAASMEHDRLEVERKRELNAQLQSLNRWGGVAY